eukprot:364323-Chlamydomonas_euryale.AAC.31
MGWHALQKRPLTGSSSRPQKAPSQPNNSLPTSPPGPRHAPSPWMQVGRESMDMRVAMQKLKEQTLDISLKAQQDADAARMERELADAQLASLQAELAKYERQVWTGEEERAGWACFNLFVHLPIHPSIRPSVRPSVHPCID